MHHIAACGKTPAGGDSQTHPTTTNTFATMNSEDLRNLLTDKMSNKNDTSEIMHYIIHNFGDAIAEASFIAFLGYAAMLLWTGNSSFWFNKNLGASLLRILIMFALCIGTIAAMWRSQFMIATSISVMIIGILVITAPMLIVEDVFFKPMKKEYFERTREREEMMNRLNKDFL